MKNLLQRLKNGEIIILSNEEFQFSIEENDIRKATLELRTGNPTWAQGFQITFNGAMLHSSKTFKSFENRLNKLIEKWNLKETENEFNF